MNRVKADGRHTDEWFDKPVIDKVATFPQAVANNPSYISEIMPEVEKSWKKARIFHRKGYKYTERIENLRNSLYNDKSTKFALIKNHIGKYPLF